MYRPTTVRFASSSPCLVLLAALCLPHSGKAAIYTVGASSPCQYASLQPALDAAKANAGSDEIRVKSNFVSSGVDYSLQDFGDLSIVGGYADCAAASPTGYTILNGRSGNSLLTVRGIGRLSLKHLVLQNGRETSNAYGGGLDISYSGSADQSLSVRLESVALQYNSAGYGGGIHVTGAKAILELGDRVRVADNTAETGAGIYCRGRATVHMAGFDSTLVGNTATGSGGGLRSEGCVVSLVNVGEGMPLVQQNRARDGGGISATGQDSNLTIYTRNSAYPATIAGNVAEDRGGGLMVASSAQANLFDASLESNSAWGAGAALYQFDNDAAPNSKVKLSSAAIPAYPGGLTPPFYYAGGAPVAPGDAVACAPLRCNRIVDNIARVGADGAWSHGAVLYALAPDAGANTQTSLFGTAVLRNQGVNLVRMATGNTDFLDPSPSAGVYFRNALIARNTTTSRLVEAIDSSGVVLEASTVVGNNIGAGAVLYQGGDVGSFIEVYRSIVDQAGKDSFFRSDVEGYTRFGSSQTRDTIPAALTSETNVLGVPLYVNAALDDYTLQYQQPGVDFARIVSDAHAGERDFLGAMRSKDLAAKPNQGGDPLRLQDIGAFERQYDATDPPLQFSVFPASAGEGDCSGATCETRAMRFAVRLTRTASTQTSVRYRIVSESAAAGVDYGPTQNPEMTLDFPLGVTEREVTIFVVGDNVPEPDETFRFELFDPMPAAMVAVDPARATATGTIRDNDRIRVSLQPPPPQLEGTDAAPGAIEFLVVLDRPLPSQGNTPFPEPLLVSYTTRDGNATAGEDYVARAGTLEFYPGQLSRSVVVPIVRDARDEEDVEDFKLELLDASGPPFEPAQIDNGSVSGVLLDDDVRPTLSVADVATMEGNDDGNRARLSFVATLSAPSGRDVRVYYDVSDISASNNDDYLISGGSLRFEPGEISKQIDVELRGDTQAEPDETFRLVLSDPRHVDLTRGFAVGTILNDDGPPPGPGQVFANGFEGAP